MNINELWTIGLTMAFSVMGWFLKEKSEELRLMSLILTKTREEMAKDYLTKNETFALILKIENHASTAKAEFHADINRVIDRLDKLCEKMDRSLENKNAL
jgi:hypothetical protein